MSTKTLENKKRLGLLGALLLIVALGLVAVSGLAAEKPAGSISAVVYKKVLGDLEIYALSDARGRLDFSIILGLTPDKIREIVGQSPEMDQNSLASYINAFLVKSPSGLFLVDTGLGDNDSLVSGLKEAGFSPADVTDVLLTHFHGDHINGLLAGGKSLFPEATIWADKNEDRYWRRETGRQAQNVESRLAPYRKAKRFQTFEPGQTIKPGLTTMALYGHTPGHSGFVFAAGGSQSLLLWGDIVHAYLVQFARPQTTVSYDVDPQAAAATRALILKKAAEAGYLVAGAHLPFPGLGQVKAVEGDSYAWVKDQ
ncbi:MAG: MBL fold metallo-hydrolase [Deltaproteobacteria bacterium]|jgi:glyoxylase-like metal-dependent hydrolase (beta-lactamase superfamily II)|nr:MBL fold metallo-hydrolase [Deltaproteobacteria bacterium]